MRAFEALWKLIFGFGTTAFVQWTDTSVHYLDSAALQFTSNCNSHTGSYQDPGNLTWAQPDWGPKSPGLQGSQSLQLAPKVPLHLESAKEVPLGLTSRGNGTCTTVSQRTVYTRTFLETPLEEHLLKCHHSYQRQNYLSLSQTDIQGTRVGGRPGCKQSLRFRHFQCPISGRPEAGRDDTSAHSAPHYSGLLPIN